MQRSNNAPRPTSVRQSKPMVRRGRRKNPKKIRSGTAGTVDIAALTVGASVGLALGICFPILMSDMRLSLCLWWLFKLLWKPFWTLFKFLCCSMAVSCAKKVMTDLWCRESVRGHRYVQAWSEVAESWNKGGEELVEEMGKARSD